MEEEEDAYEEGRGIVIIIIYPIIIIPCITIIIFIY